MILGIIFLGMLAGGLVAVAALVAGQGFWVALALYAGCGMLATLAGAVVLAFGARGAPEGRLAGYGATRPQRG